MNFLTVFNFSQKQIVEWDRQDWVKFLNQHRVLKLQIANSDTNHWDYLAKKQIDEFALAS